MSRVPRLRRALLAGALLTSTLTAAVATPASAAPPDTPASERVGADVAATLAEDGAVDVIVMLEGHRPGSDVAALRRASGAAQDTTLAGFAEDDFEHLHRFETVPAFSARISDEAVLDRLARRPGIRRIDVDAVIEPQAGSQYPEEEGVVVADHVGATDLHELGLTGEGATVAVIDSGIDRDHPDFEGATIHEACFAPSGWEDREYRNPDFCPGGWFGRGSSFAEGPGTAKDGWYHGTAAAGVVASRGNLADIGMAPSADIVALKVMEVCPPGPEGGVDPCPYATSTVMRAGDYLASRPDLGVDVLSMSLGLRLPYQGTYCDDADSNAMIAKSLIDNLRAAGTFAVASAGNDGKRDQIGMPACLSNVVSVGATRLGPTGETVEGYSNTGPGLDVLAPAWTLHPEPANGTGTMRGTSSAAPVVAGCAAVLLRMDAQPTLDAVADAMRTTGIPIDRDGATYRRLDCAAAAQQIDPSIGADAPPAVTPVVSGEIGDDGWYTGNVTVRWNVRSSTPVTSTDGCDEVVVDADTAGVELTCRATNESGTGEATTTVKRDATPPVLEPTVTPNPVQQGAEATVDAGVSDATSGVARQLCNPALTDEVGTFEVHCQAIDRAGNTASGSATYEVVGDGGSAACVEAPNPDHVSAGRATTYWGYAFAVGTRDSLGRNTSSNVTSLRQEGPESWTRVTAC